MSCSCHRSSAEKCRGYSFLLQQGCYKSATKTALKLPENFPVTSLFLPCRITPGKRLKADDMPVKRGAALRKARETQLQQVRMDPYAVCETVLPQGFSRFGDLVLRAIVAQISFARERIILRSWSATRRLRRLRQFFASLSFLFTKKINIPGKY